MFFRELLENERKSGEEKKLYKVGFIVRRQGLRGDTQMIENA